MGKYNQIMNKKRMTADEAINIIDEMYQDKMKQIEKNNTIYVDRLYNIEFTNLEFAGVILLREVQSLRRKLENSIPKEKIETIKIKYKEKYKQHKAVADEYFKKEGTRNCFDNELAIRDLGAIRVCEELLKEN